MYYRGDHKVRFSLGTPTAVASFGQVISHSACSMEHACCEFWYSATVTIRVLLIKSQLHHLNACGAYVLVVQVGFEPTHPGGTDLQSAAALQLDR